MTEYEENDGKTKKLNNISQAKVKKSYRKPQLTNFGHIEKLTQGQTGPGSDGGSGRPKA